MNINLKKIKLQPVRAYSKANSDMLNLTVGEGHFNSPFSAKLKAYEALLTNKTKYSLVEGSEKLREKIINKYYPNYNKDNEIVITNGSTQALFITLLSLISSSTDEIIIIAPYYPAYYNVTVLLGAKAIIINSSNNNFKINSDLLDKYVSPNTKAIIINEPNNPTGITYTLSEKKALIDYFKKHTFYIIIDEIYKTFTDDEFVPFSSIIDNDLKERFIFINGFSKSHMMTGYRIGYVLSNKEINHLLKTLNYLTVSSISTIMQEAALGAIDDDYFKNFVSRYYLNNLKIIQTEFDDLKINYVKGNGGYYLFMNTERFNLTGNEFIQNFRKKYGIALVPGELFGKDFSYYVRISCCKDIKDIVKFLNAIRHFSTKSL